MKNSFAVSPMIEKINLKPGETYTGVVTVANPKDATEDFRYKATISPYSVSGEDYTADFKTMTDWSRIAEWTEIENDEGVLKPNETKKVRYTIKVPADAPGGGQYLNIGISSNNPFAQTEGGTVQNIYEMASLVFATVEGEIKHDGKIVDSKIPGFITTGKPVISAKLTNDGNVHETAKTTVTVKSSIGGGQIYPKDGENSTMESTIMPQTTRVVSREIPNMPAVGVFEVTQTVSYMDEELLYSSIMIICPVWFIILVIGFIASIIGMVFYGRHLKHKKFKKELHSDKTNAKIEP